MCSRNSTVSVRVRETDSQSSLRIFQLRFAVPVCGVLGVAHSSMLSQRRNGPAGHRLHSPQFLCHMHTQTNCLSSLSTSSRMPEASLIFSRRANCMTSSGVADGSPTTGSLHQASRIHCITSNRIAGSIFRAQSLETGVADSPERERKRVTARNSLHQSQESLESLRI